jgi:phenylpropionate dioxygenase-like ring-hydroxylating dioxygenase large terminal subunit
MTATQEVTRERYAEAALIPKELYISRDYLRAEYERLWPRVWQMACRVEEVPGAGDYFEYVIGQQSVAIVRDESGELRGFRNTCPHRATRLYSGQGNAGGELRCPFHGWAWRLDGSVLEIPDADDFAPQCLSRRDLQLREARVDTWGGFVFVNMSENPEPLLSFLGPVTEGLAPFEVDKMRLIRHRTTVLDCNWKIGLAAFNEAYHVEATHAWDLSGYGAYVGGMQNTDVARNGQRVGPPVGGRINVRDAVGRTPGAYQVLYDVYETHNRMRNAPELLTEGVRLADYPDPRAQLLSQLRVLQRLSLAHQDDLDYVAGMTDPPADRTVLQVLTDVRRKVGAAGGVDYSAIPDEDMLAAVDYCIYPNLVGPVNAGNWILFRFRPNGDDPDSCLYDVMFLHRFGAGEEPPRVEREFYPAWEDHDDWGPVIGQDLSNMSIVQAGMHDPSFTGLRLNRQEMGVRNHAKFVQRLAGSAG